MEQNNLSDDEKEKLYDYVNNRYWSVYSSHTAQISDICRQLAFGEAGFCWALIMLSLGNKTWLIGPICVVLILLISFFICDLAQYISTKNIYKKRAKKLDDGIEGNTIKSLNQLGSPLGINSCAEILFRLKLYSLISASVIFTVLLMAIIKLPI